MKNGKMWYHVALVVLSMLSLSACGANKGGATLQTQQGYAVKVAGTVNSSGAAKAAGKALAATGDSGLGTVTVYNAQDGSQLATGSVDSSGNFTGLSFTLPTVKAVLVFKAVVAQGTFRDVLPLDLSNPPSATLASNSVSITISQDSTNVATTVSAMLGLTGVLGDPGMTLASVSKTYSDAASQVASSGGQLLSYSSTGLVVNGSVTNTALLPAADASTFTNDDLNNISLDGKVISAFIPGKNPVVNFQVVNKATGKGISGLRTFALHVAQLQPESNGSNSYWLNYIDKGISNPAPLAFATTGSGASAKAVAGCITKPSADPGRTLNADGSVLLAGYTVIDHGDGSYTAVFGSDITSNPNVTFDANLTHRIAVTVSSIAVPGVTATGPINPATGAVNTNFNAVNRTALVYDFVPATGLMLTDATGKQVYARDIVNAAACNQCHVKMTLISGHTGTRPDTRVCVVCHTKQNTSGEGDFTTFIHRIHMGEDLKAPVSPESVLNPTKPLAKTATLIPYGDQTYPQDIRNCTMCHQGADVNNWYTKPSQKACGSCHNDINFASGHSGPKGAGPAQTDDSQCSTCHAASSLYGADLTHLPVTAPDQNSVVQQYVTLGFSGYSAAQAATGVAPGNSNTNAAYTVGSSVSRLPGGANTITYVVSSVSRNSSKQPVITFKFQKNGADVVFNDPTQTAEMMNGYVGSPSVYFAYAVPQDGISAPSDYNASASGYLKRIWNNTAAAVGQASQAGTMTGPVNGYYTVTLTGVTIPDNAVMLTGGIGYTYGLGSVKTKVSGIYLPFATTTMPLTQTDIPSYPYFPVAGTPVGIGGLSVPAPNVWKVAAGYTGRRLIVDTAKCNACHGRLGVKPTFHAGQRNDAQSCTFCHNVNRVNSGWGVNIKEAVHAIHASGKRVNKFSWEATAGDQFWNVTYPGYLRDCEQCHIPGMYDFSSSAYSTTTLNNMLATTVATGSISSSATVIVSGSEATNVASVVSPFVTLGGNYGAGYAVSGSGVPTDAASTTLISSPIASACYACHDTDLAKSHMVQNGGALWEARATALGKKETCLVCHGTAANTLNSTVPTIKAVHRWW